MWRPEAEDQRGLYIVLHVGQLSRTQLFNLELNQMELSNADLLYTFTGIHKRMLEATSFFKDKMSQKSHKTVGNKVFLTIFA
jgi:hypothetical protein